MKVKTWNCKISVAQQWIDDGFELTKEELEQMILNRLPFADQYEIDVTVKRGRKEEI